MSNATGADDAAAARPRFLVDANCGRLATWLRVLGFDAARPPALADDQVLRRAAREGRIILTRDRSIAQSRLVRAGRVRAYLVRAEEYDEQVREVVTALGLGPLLRPFTRCVVCNTPLVRIPLERAWGRVPVYVYATQDQFDECPRCRRVFWRGTHHAAVERFVATLG